MSIFTIIRSGKNKYGKDWILDLIFVTDFSLPLVHFILLVYLGISYLPRIHIFRAFCLLLYGLSYFLTIWPCTVYIQKLHIYVSCQLYSVPPIFKSYIAFSIAYIVRASLIDIWAPGHSFFCSFVILLDINILVYFSTVMSLAYAH